MSSFYIHNVLLIINNANYTSTYNAGLALAITQLANGYLQRNLTNGSVTIRVLIKFVIRYDPINQQILCLRLPMNVLT